MDQLDAVSALVGWVPVDRFARDRRQRSALDLARPGSAVATVLASCGLGVPRPPLGDRYAERTNVADIALLAHVAAASGVERRDLGDGFLVRTGPHDNRRNGVVCSHLPRDVDVDAIVTGFAALPARWYVTPPTEPHDLPARIETAGCRAERSAAHMAAELDELDGATSGEVRDVHDAIDLVHVDADEARLLAAAGPPLRHFVIDGVAGLTTFIAGATLLGVHLRVERGCRRRGLARTLIRHAVAVGLADGCTHAVLAPTPATITLYERLGFVLERSLPDRWYYLP